MTYGWIVKIRRYDGSTSVVKQFTLEPMARNYAGRLNEEYQTNTYYVERYDPSKALS